MARTRAWPSSRPVTAYFALAYAISLGVWLPRIATVQGWWQVDVPEWWHYLGAAGPVSAALLIAALSEGREGVLGLLGQYSPRRAATPWLAFAVLSPLLLLSIALVTARLADGAWPAYDELANAGDLPQLGLPITLAVHTLTFGVGEETGWRGFALPRLQRQRSAMQATRILALFWGLWHLPSFLENDSMMDMGALQIFGWTVGLWMGAIFLTWLYNSSCGSLLTVVIWHGLFNQFAASEASSTLAAVMSVGVIVIVIAAIRLAGPQELRGLSEHADRRRQHPDRAPSPAG